MNEIHDVERCTDDAHDNTKNHHEPRLHLLSNDSLLLLGGPSAHSLLSLAYTKYIQPGMANMISEPNREPFRPMTTSTFVIRIATVTVESRTPAAVL